MTLTRLDEPAEYAKPRSEDEASEQDSTNSVFTLAADGSPSRFCSAHPRLADDIPERGIDLLSPLWPQGREPWSAGLDY